MPRSYKTRRHTAQDTTKIRSAEAWDRIRDAVRREHRLIAALDPRSPRIRPTLALSIGVVLP